MILLSEHVLLVPFTALVMEEALGSSNTAQVLDLLPNNANLNIYTPAYAIYEGENLESSA